MISESSRLLLQDIISNKRISYAEIYSEDLAFLHLFYEDQRIEPIVSEERKGYGLRLFRRTNGSTPEVLYLSSNEEEKIRSLAEKVLGNRIDSSAQGIVPPKIKKFIHPLKISPNSIPLKEKINLLKNTEIAARQMSREIAQVSLHYGERKKNISFFNSEGAAYIEERQYIIFSLEVIAKRGEIIQTASEVVGGLLGYEIFQIVNLEKLAQKVAARALAKLSAPEAPLGEMPVVLSSSAGGTMIHEAIGHSLEADSVQKGISPVYQGKIGQKVASELVTVIDDPTLMNKNGSYAYDDEGGKAEKTILIENGILKNYLYDRYTAEKDKRISNAHGRRESYHSKPIPRMSNTYLLSGKDEPENIICSVEKGILVKKMGGGQVNTATGDFVFEVEEGCLIENGQIGPLVRGAILLGNGPDVLQSIDMFGDDLGWSIGVCGKDGQGVPVSDGLPTLRIKKLLIGGSKKA